MKRIRLMIIGLVVCTAQAQFQPRVSIITSVFKGDFFIREFMEDIVQQTIFPDCELIMINAASPGNEEPIIREYMERYPNIVYVKLDKDPGLYGVWNLGITMARAAYITNANLDDRLKFDCYEVHADYLDMHPSIDGVYSGLYVTNKPNETFEHNSSGGTTLPWGQQQFNAKDMLYLCRCYPNNHPMWRKSMHQKAGLFDERYKSAGDLEMWLRATTLGGCTFAMIEGIYALYYENPEGLSTATTNKCAQERAVIHQHYFAIYETILNHITYLPK